MLNLIGPGINKLAEKEGCSSGAKGFVPCLSFENRSKTLDISALSGFFLACDYTGLTNYIVNTCKSLKRTENKKNA